MLILYVIKKSPGDINVYPVNIKKKKKRIQQRKKDYERFSTFQS